MASCIPNTSQPALKLAIRVGAVMYSRKGWCAIIVPNRHCERIGIDSDVTVGRLTREREVARTNRQHDTRPPLTLNNPRSTWLDYRLNHGLGPVQGLAATACFTTAVDFGVRGSLGVRGAKRMQGDHSSTKNLQAVGVLLVCSHGPLMQLLQLQFEASLALESWACIFMCCEANH
jgi:hypothetical protein